MEIIKDYETFKNFYLSTHKWVKTFSTSNQENYIKGSFKSSLMIKTFDDYIILLDKKPIIDSELLYDDETPRPQITLDFFIDYNIRNFHYDYDEYLKNKMKYKMYGSCSGMYSLNLLLLGSKETITGVACRNDAKNVASYIRDLTDEEEKEYLKICDDLKNQYIERLKKYFKRYRDKIHTRGYWANR